MTNRKMKSLILLEYPSEIDFKHFEEDSCCVFLTPESTLLIRNRQYLRCYYPEDVISSHELDTLGMEHFGKAKELATELDKALEMSNQKIKEEQLNIALYNVDRFKIMYDSVVGSIMILEKIIKHFSPEQLYYQNSEFLENIDLNLCFRNESIFVKLVPLIAKKYSISAMPLKEKIEMAVAAPKQTIPEIGRKLTLLNLAKVSHAFLLTCLTVVKSVLNSSREHIVILRSFPEEDDLLSYEVKKKGFKISWYDPVKKKLSKTNNKFIDKLRIKKNGPQNGLIRFNPHSIKEIKKKIRGCFIHEDIDWFPVIERRMECFIEHCVPLVFQCYVNTLKAFNGKRVGLVLTYAEITNSLEGVLCHAMWRLNIPIVKVQHGSFAVHPNECLKKRIYELSTHSYFLTWGEGVNHFFKEEAKENNVKQIPIGSSTLKIIHRNSKKKNHIKTIYYIPTHFRGRITYYPGGSHYLDTWYYNLMGKVINILKNYDQYEFVFKIHHADKCLMLFEKLIGNVKHIKLSNKPFVSIIQKADAFIIDFPSTTLLQCAATMQPVVVYTGEHCVHVDGKALQSLRKRAVCSKTITQFIKEIENFLIKPTSYSADVMNDEFLGLYGTNNSSDNINWSKVLQQITLNERLH